MEYFLTQLLAWLFGERTGTDADEVLIRTQLGDVDQPAPWGIIVVADLPNDWL